MALGSGLVHLGVASAASSTSPLIKLMDDIVVATIWVIPNSAN